MDEEKLLRRLRRGSQLALGEMIRTYSGYVLKIVENRAHGFLTPEDAEEVAADVFYALWQNADQVKNLKSWLGGVARNKTIDRMRQQKIALPLEEQTAIAPEDDLCEMAEAKEQRAQLHLALQTLSDEDQEIFFRYYERDETTKMISEAMGLNPSTVRTRLSRGRMELRKTLGGYLDEENYKCV